MQINEEKILAAARSLVSSVVKELRARDEGTLVRTYSGEDTLVAAVSYIPVVAPAILVFRKENSEFVSFHARQSLVTLLLTAFLLLVLPNFFKLLVAPVFISLLVFGVYRALQGKKWYFPLVTEIANSIDL